MLSKSLEETLRRAMTNASSLKHEFATLEHLLFALLEDQDAIEVLKACSVNVKTLGEDINKYLKEDLKAIITSDTEADTQPTAGFQRVVQRAVIHVQTSGKEEVTSANILVAIFSERESHAVYFLNKVNFSFLFGSLFLDTKTVFPGSKRPIIEPVLGQCAVIFELFTLISIKNLLYRLISLPLIKVLVNFIFINLYLYMKNKKEINAGIIIIGNEVLSGRTKDVNTSTLSLWLNSLGVQVKEVRIIPDIEKDIIETINTFKNKFSYVFTTGGIGPTHDDITAESVSKAFNIEYGYHKEAFSILKNYFSQG